VSAVRVLHVIAAAQRRGAEVFAADLLEAVRDGGQEHRVALLRGGDFRFPAPTLVVHARRRLPGIRMDPGAAGRLRGVVRRWRPSVIVAHGGEAFKYSLAARGRRPLIYRRIGWASPSAHRWPRRVFHARLMRRADLVICLAEAVRQETIQRFGLPPEDVITIPNASDARKVTSRRGRARTRADLGIDDRAPVILSLGALVWEKDPVGHLDVTERVGARVPGLVHLFVGQGPLAGALESAVVRRGLEGTVRLLGSRSDVPDILAAADVMLMASKSEGLPTVLIEAGMAGVPAVSYRIAGVPEVIEDGETGILVPAGDVDALADAALRLLVERQVARRVGEAARRVCHERFAIRVVAPQYVDVFSRLAGPP
jgi:glycosyltransferase involved in cell wall biosynthesis